jgi:hypothetical protein
MVSSVLRVVGLSQVRSFQTYHRVMNRAKWSSEGASRILLRLLLALFAPTGPLIFGLDETIERRRGAKIAATGIYRDPVRSSHSHFVKVNGLRSRLSDAAGSDPLGGPRLGAPIPDGAGPI